MRNSAFYAAILLAATASAAHAQGYAQQTLDSQYQRVHPGQPTPPAGATPSEWPANAADATRPGADIGSVGDGAIPALPLQVQTSGTVTYINGGISDEEEAQLKAQGNDYNLHVLLSAPTGEFIGDVSLRVLDDKGNAILTVPDAGPYVYAKLPAGRYTLEATHGGTSKQMKISVPAKSRLKEHFVFEEQGFGRAQ